MLDRFEAKIIQEEQIRAHIVAQSAFPGSVCSAAVEMLEHFLYANKQHIQTLPGGFLPKSLSQVCLTHSGRAADHQVGVYTNVLTSGQLQDLLADSVWIELEIKAFNGFGRVERTAAQAQSELFLGSAFGLILQKSGEEVHSDPAFQVVNHQPLRHTPEERQGIPMTVQPGLYFLIKCKFT